MKKYFFILNPVSKGGRSAKFQRQVKAWIQENLPEAKVKETQYAGHGVVLGRQAAEEGYQNCISVGGDGTLHEVINGILAMPKRERPRVGIIPSGTGGDFFRSLKEDYFFPKNLNWLKNPSEIRIDVGLAHLSGNPQKIQKRYFINVADMGLSGEVIRRVNQGFKFLGSLEYLRATLISGWSYRPLPVQVSGFYSEEGRSIQETNLLILVVANGRFFGGGMCIAPDAQVNDQKFQFLLAEQVSYFSLIPKLLRLYRRNRVQHPRVHYGVGDHISVKALSGLLPLNLDGEFLEAGEVKFELIPQEIRILVGSEKNTHG